MTPRTSCPTPSRRGAGSSYARRMPFNVGLPELMIVLVIALIVLGPKKLPEVGRSLGNGMREFRDSISGTGGSSSSSRRRDDEDEFPALR